MLMKKKDMSAHFERIWELSIEIRNQNFEMIDEVIDKSGLIELLMELRKSSKIVFIALVHRFMYVRWFADRFASLINNEVLDGSVSLEKFEMIVHVDIPTVDYLVATSKVSEKPPGTAPEGFTFEFLMQSLSAHSEKITDAISFNAEQAMTDLDIGQFEGPDFEDTIAYADAFFAHLERSVADKLLKNEAKTSRAIFKQFTTLCAQKELSMVTSVFGLRDSLKKIAYAKCTHEMEAFSAKFRATKKGNRFEGEPFDFDVASVNDRIRSLAASLVLLGTPVIIQTLVSFDSIVALARELADRGMMYSSDEEFLFVAKNIPLDVSEIEMIELCLRITECVECFDTRQFLSLFPKSREEEVLLLHALSTKRVPNPILSLTQVDIEEEDDSTESEESGI
jgi:hypothetical protein